MKNQQWRMGSTLVNEKKEVGEQSGLGTWSGNLRGQLPDWQNLKDSLLNWTGKDTKHYSIVRGGFGVPPEYRQI